jgi:hypothetical protein
MDKDADAGTALFPMIKPGVRTARSPRESGPHPRLTPHVAAAQRLFTATLPTPWSGNGHRRGRWGWSTDPVRTKSIRPHRRPRRHGGA